MIFHQFSVALLVILFPSVLSWEEDSEFYTLSANDIEMRNVEMNKYHGKVVLVVNVASECGYTDQYRDLVDLQRSFGKHQFEVLAFPCNQFGKQEPKNNKFIHQFAKTTYHVNFQMFGKVKTIGQYSHPLYKWLKEQSNVEPNWNFNKYLIDKNGFVVRYAPSNVSPMEMIEDIKALVADNPLDGGIFAYNKRHEEL